MVNEPTTRANNFLVESAEPSLFGPASEAAVAACEAWLADRQAELDAERNKLLAERAQLEKEQLAWENRRNGEIWRLTDLQTELMRERVDWDAERDRSARELAHQRAELERARQEFEQQSQTIARRSLATLRLARTRTRQLDRRTAQLEIREKLANWDAQRLESQSQELEAEKRSIATQRAQLRRRGRCLTRIWKRIRRNRAEIRTMQERELEYRRRLGKLERAVQWAREELAACWREAQEPPSPPPPIGALALTPEQLEHSIVEILCSDTEADNRIPNASGGIQLVGSTDSDIDPVSSETQEPVARLEAWLKTLEERLDMLVGLVEEPVSTNPSVLTLPYPLSARSAWRAPLAGRRIVPPVVFTVDEFREAWTQRLEQLEDSYTALVHSEQQQCDVLRRDRLEMVLAEQPRWNEYLTEREQLHAAWLTLDTARCQSLRIWEQLIGLIARVQKESEKMMTQRVRVSNVQSQDTDQHRGTAQSHQPETTTVALVRDMVAILAEERVQLEAALSRWRHDGFDRKRLVAELESAQQSLEVRNQLTSWLEEALGYEREARRRERSQALHLVRLLEEEVDRLAAALIEASNPAEPKSASIGAA